MFNSVIKKKKLTFKTVGIGSASVSRSHGPKAHNSIHENWNYHQYLAEAWRGDHVLIATIDVDLGDGRTVRTSFFPPHPKSQIARFVIAL
jgi:hypothetical protein